MKMLIASMAVLAGFSVAQAGTQVIKDSSDDADPSLLVIRRATTSDGSDLNMVPTFAFAAHDCAATKYWDKDFRLFHKSLVSIDAIELKKLPDGRTELSYSCVFKDN